MRRRAREMADRLGWLPFPYPEAALRLGGDLIAKDVQMGIERPENLATEIWRIVGRFHRLLAPSSQFCSF